MVLGLGSKKKGAAVKVEFQIDVQEIKPWKVPGAPGANKPLLVQWQRGDNRYGKTRSALPKPDDGGKVVFNDTFRLPATLTREPEGKGRNAAIPKFQKKAIVFTLLEATTDQQLGRCVVDLADYGDLDTRVPASVPLAVGKKVSAGAQAPMLYLTIGPLEKKEERSFAARVSFGSSSARNSISKAPETKIQTTVSNTGKSKAETALDDEERKSIVASLMSDDDDHVSIESFTDDEASPEDITPSSDTTPKSSTTTRSEISKISTTPPRFGAPKPSSSTPDTTSKSVNRSTSNSDSPLSAVPTQSTSIREASTKLVSTSSSSSPPSVATTLSPSLREASKSVNAASSSSPATPTPSTSLPETPSKAVNALSTSSSSVSSAGSLQSATQSSTNGSARRPTPTKHGPGKTSQNSAPSVAEIKAEELKPAISKQDAAKAPENKAPKIFTSAEKSPGKPVPAVSSVIPVMQPFSTDDVEKSTKDVEKVSKKPLSSQSSDLPISSGPSPESGSQPSKIFKQDREEASRVAPVLADSTSGGSINSIRGNRSAATSFDSPSSVNPIKDGRSPVDSSNSPNSINTIKGNKSPAKSPADSVDSPSSTNSIKENRSSAASLDSPSGVNATKGNKSLADSMNSPSSINSIKENKSSAAPLDSPSGVNATKGSKTLADSVDSPSGVNSIKGNRSLTALDSPRSSTNRFKDRQRSGSIGEGQTARESPRVERPKSFRAEASAEKEQAQTTGAPPRGPSASAKAAAGAASTAYVAKRMFIPPKRSSLDYSHDNSDDSSSESSNEGTSLAQTGLYDKPQVSSRSLSTTATAVDIEGRKDGKEAGGKIERKFNERKEDAQNVSEASGREGPNLKSDRSTKIPADKRDSEGDLQTKLETAPVKQEEEGGEDTSVLGSARANLGKAEKRALEELRTKVANAESKFLAESQKVEALRGELRDIGAMELSLYCVVAEHGISSHKLHTPARRLARLYMHAHKHWTPDRRAGTAKNFVSGLVTVSKSCGSDVSRLSFWWSNVVALRSVLTRAFENDSSLVSKADVEQASSGGAADGVSSTNSAKGRTSVFRPSLSGRALNKIPPSPKPLPNDWELPDTCITALLKVEEWIYSKIVESLWWQAMIPRMQKDVDASAPTSPKGMVALSPAAVFGEEFTNKAKEDLSNMSGDFTGIFVRKQSGKSAANLPELGDARQGNLSVEIWKKAIMEALRRLCPVRGAGHDCGCLPMLIRMAIEGCLERLDVALFNAILREPEDDVPTDPTSDPVGDPSVLPVSPGGLTFGGGVQLKNVVVTWSSFVTGLVPVKEPVFAPDADNADNGEEDTEKSSTFFNLIKATGDLLMLPKDSFMDKAMRKEICPNMSLELIRRILINFVPDEFAPDPISPSLLAALNTEASIDKQRQGHLYDISTTSPIAAAPPVVYVAPPVSFVWSWIGEESPDPRSWGRSSNSLLRKGYTSDEDLNAMDQLQRSSASDKLEVLLGGARKGSTNTANGNRSEKSSSQPWSQSVGDTGLASRFELLQEVWGT